MFYNIFAHKFYYEPVFPYSKYAQYSSAPVF